MKKEKQALDFLEKELDSLNQSQAQNTPSGQSSPQSIEDIWQNILNGDFTNVPAGTYDFNTGTFTPYNPNDPSFMGSEWHVVIETVVVTGYNTYGDGYSSGTGNPTDFFNSLLTLSNPFVAGSGGVPYGYGYGGSGGPGALGVINIVSSTDTNALNNLNYTPNPAWGGFNTEVEYLQFFSEHYGDDRTTFLKYLADSNLFQDSVLNTTDPGLKNFLDINNSNRGQVPGSLAAVYFAVTLAKINTVLLTSPNPVSDLIALWTGLDDVIIGAGDLGGKLDTDFEKELFQLYWDGETESYTLSQARFNQIKSYVPNIDPNATGFLPFTASNGQTYRLGGISLYNTHPELDYSIGSAVGIFNSAGQLVAIYDFYDFNSANREWHAEFATRMVNALSHNNVSPFRIFGGATLPADVWDAAEAYRQAQEGN